MPQCLPHGTEDLSSGEPQSQIINRDDPPQNLSLRLRIGAFLNLPVMPRKRRPTPPAPGSLPIRNIAPKPYPDSPTSVRPRLDESDQASNPTPSSSRQSTSGSGSEPGSCGVPQCPIPNCRLATHLSYGRQRRALLLHQSVQPSSSSSSSSTEGASSRTIQLSPDSDLILPIADTTGQDFRRLFTTFFQPKGPFERLVLIGRPSIQRDLSFKQNTYRLALKNPIYCLTMVALSHMEIFKAQSNAVLEPEADRLTDTIYTKLLTMAREKVSNLESDDKADIDILLHAIIALCEYDLILDRHDALRSHHSGLTALVARRGGVHNLGLSLPYVLRMDRFLAVRANQIPQFAAPEIPGLERLSEQVPPPDTNFGDSFRDESSTSITQPVRTLCVSAAHLLALMDDLEVTFDPTTASDQPKPKLEYFYYLRESNEARHAVLNYQLHSALESALQAAKHSPSKLSAATTIRKNLLVLTATRIVTYYIATGNYLPVVSDTLATRLWNLLTQNNSSSPKSEAANLEDKYVPTVRLADWTNDMPLLLWLLFACALPGSRDGTLTFIGHLTPQYPSQTQLLPFSSSSSSLSVDRTQASASASDRSRAKSATQSQRIVSPSSPRRHRYLPSFILHVAEHLVGERPLSGTDEWDEEIIEILESFVWNGERLDAEFSRIIARVHEDVVRRAEEDESEDEDDDENDDEEEED